MNKDLPDLIVALELNCHKAAVLFTRFFREDVLLSVIRKDFDSFE